MTLDEIIAQVIQNNPTAVQARLRAQRAHKVIAEATGQAKPQVRVTGSDTYTSVVSSGSSAGSLSQVQPVGSIPTITDSAQGTLGTTTETSSGTTSLSSGAATTVTSTGSTSTTTSTLTINPVSTPTTGGATSTTTSTPQMRQPDDVVNHASSGTSGTGSTTTSSSFGLRHNNYAASGSATLLVDLFGLVNANNDVAYKSAQFYDLDTERVSDDLALSAKDTYYAVLRAQSSVATAEEQLTNAQATLKDAQIKANAGTGTQFDVISAETGVSSAEQSLISARNDLDIQRANLNNYLSRPLDTPFSVSETPLVILPTDASAEAAISKAYETRPEILESSLSEEIAADFTKLARAGELPEIGLTGGVAYSPTVSVLQTSHYTESIAAGISIPLYDGGQTKARVGAARIDEATQRSITLQLKENVALEVRSALVNVVDAQALVTANQDTVTEARESVRLATIRYSAGVGTLLEVTNAQANLINAENNLNSAVYQQQTNYAALLRAEGVR